MATQSVPPGGSRALESGGQNHRRPTSGPADYIRPATWMFPNASEWETKLEVAHQWIGCFTNPNNLGVSNASG